MKSLITFLLSLMVWGNIHSQISIIGPATPSGNWTTDHNLMQTSPGVWTGTFVLSAAELKFRQDGSWANNWGNTTFPNGIGIPSSPDNIPVSPGGTYYITFNTTTLAYTFGTPPPSNNVGIGTTSPTEKLDVAGNIRTIGEIKPNGTSGAANQVLTSNGDGTMQWAAMSNGEENTGNGNWGDCTVNNITAFQPVSNENGAYSDYFGNSVSISGDYAIVGAHEDDEDGGVENGSATIFRRNSSSGIWESQGKLINPVTQSSDEFGYSVSISGDYAIVGAYLDDEGMFNNGSATIFRRNSSSGIWESQGKLTNPGASEADLFGYSVSISGDYAIVGAIYDNEGMSNNGSATIFKRNASSGTWEQQGSKLTNPSAADYDYFGTSVSISGDYAIVGANNDDEGGLTNNGSATIFKRNASSGTWEQQGSKLTNPSAADNDYFGTSVSISGDYAIVGGLTNNGSATIFKRNPSTGAWGWKRQLTNPDAASGDSFGKNVSISGDYAIVGALGDDEGGLTNNGSATVFRRYGNIWRVVQKFTHPSSAYGDNFGSSTAIDSNGRFLVGAKGVQDLAGMAFFGKVR